MWLINKANVANWYKYLNGIWYLIKLHISHHTFFFPSFYCGSANPIASSPTTTILYSCAGTTLLSPCPATPLQGCRCRCIDNDLRGGLHPSLHHPPLHPISHLPQCHTCLPSTFALPLHQCMHSTLTGKLGITWVACSCGRCATATATLNIE